MTPFDELRHLAQGATPGPWWATEDLDEDDDPAVGVAAGPCPDYRSMVVVTPGSGSFDAGHRTNHEADASFIAAANPTVVLSVLDELERRLTGGDVATWMGRRGHPTARICPGCGEDCSTVGIPRLAYVFVTCTCDLADMGPHLVEQLWHTVCLIEGAAEVTQRELLEAAAYALDGGRQSAHRQSVRDRILRLLGRADEPKASVGR